MTNALEPREKRRHDPIKIPPRIGPNRHVPRKPPAADPPRVPAAPPTAHGVLSHKLSSSFAGRQIFLSPADDGKREKPDAPRDSLYYSARALHVRRRVGATRDVTMCGPPPARLSHIISTYVCVSLYRACQFATCVSSPPAHTHTHVTHILVLLFFNSQEASSRRSRSQPEAR